MKLLIAGSRSIQNFDLSPTSIACLFKEVHSLFLYSFKSKTVAFRPKKIVKKLLISKGFCHLLSLFALSLDKISKSP
ncbi:MAG: hypothetical protein IKB75_07595 [Clostridia bacterium]|nr:hypothetical protein [Clostridia bacterium]